MKRRLLVFVLIATILAPLAVGYAAETIKIGALYTMTGRGGQYGKDSEVAIKMALNEENANGLPGGRKLEVIITDDKNPQYAVSVAKRYISEDKTKFLFGIISSAIGLAVTEVRRAGSPGGRTNGVDHYSCSGPGNSADSRGYL